MSNLRRFMLGREVDLRIEPEHEEPVLDKPVEVDEEAIKHNEEDEEEDDEAEILIAVDLIVDLDLD